jgi:hypothetical protein
MKRAFRELRDTYSRISEDMTEDTPLIIFIDGRLPIMILALAVIALCLSISTGIMYLGVQVMGTRPPLVLYPLALIVNALYCLGGMVVVGLLMVGGFLLAAYGVYWMVVGPLTVGVWLWSLVPGGYIRRK